MRKLLLGFFIIGFILSPLLVHAQETETAKMILPTSRLYFLVKAKEFIQLNLLTFNQPSKAKVLGTFADQRVKEITYATSIKDTQAVDLSLDRYQTQTMQALEYAQKSQDTSTVDQLKNEMLEQQKTMTQNQLKIEDNEQVQTKIVVVQKQVANQTNEVVRVVQGEEKANQLDVQTKVIWQDPNATADGKLPPLPDKWEYAPGTEGRDNTGKVVIENTVDQSAPGSEGQGTPEVKIETNLNQSQTTTTNQITPGLYIKKD